MSADRWFVRRTDPEAPWHLMYGDGEGGSTLYGVVVAWADSAERDAALQELCRIVAEREPLEPHPAVPGLYRCRECGGVTGRPSALHQQTVQQRLSRSRDHLPSCPWRQGVEP